MQQSKDRVGSNRNRYQKHVSGFARRKEFTIKIAWSKVLQLTEIISDLEKILGFLERNYYQKKNDHEKIPKKILSVVLLIWAELVEHH